MAPAARLLPVTEREITEPVDLCQVGGMLNQDAVGWARRPLHRANLPRRAGRGWGRTKRWEYWGVVSATHAVGVQVSSLDYAAVHGLYVLERATGREWREDATVVPSRGVSLPDRAARGRVSVNAGPIAVTIDQSPDRTSITATSPSICLDLVAERPSGQESMSVVVPWSHRRFQYTLKDLALPAHGTLDLDGVTRTLGPDAYAVLDHGRGLWPYRMTWNWGAGSGPGGNAIQLGGRWTDGTGSTENALLKDGVVHKIDAHLSWHYDRKDWLRPWRITGDGVDARFVPFHDRVARAELGLVGNRTHQCFGTYEGTARADDGTELVLDGLVGWAEEARNRW